MRALKTDSIDFSILQDWMSFCKDKHTGGCNISQQDEGRIGLKVIDCETLMLVDLGDLEYLTLSYQWGVGEKAPEYSIALPNLGSLPATIRDSITATLKLGYRYIWIDRYCIDQSNIKDAMRQIQKMDIIYRHSEATLIAVGGTGPSYGLPGVSERQRQMQYRFQFGDKEFVGPIHFVDGVVNKSRWGTRGWTFQEGALSRRRFIFTDQQVYFECHEMCCYE
ncbi:HET-domain-containing protein, partial [Mytilinidion resinicola]